MVSKYAAHQRDFNMRKVKLDTKQVYLLYGERCLEAKQRLLATEELKDSWQISAGVYPNKRNPDGAGIQLFKGGWFNDTGGGLHFETWIKKTHHERGELPFVFHIEVGKARAGFGQREFRDEFLACCGDQLTRKGYEINPRYAMEPVRCFRKFTEADFLDVCVKEFLFLSRFGSKIDRSIAKLTKGTKHEGK